MPDHDQIPSVAYFSMEIGINPQVPTYAGGLGILAGDTLRSMSDLEMAAIGVTLLHRHGYFEQKLDSEGNQSEMPVTWRPEEHLALLHPHISLAIEGRTVTVRAWRWSQKGASGSVVPVIFLDTDVKENTPGDRAITSQLYGGDARYRLLQEAVLGIGGLRMLRALGHSAIRRFHMNEGHAALLAAELLREFSQGQAADMDFGAVRERCVFTTHTPVAAGHDQFDYSLVESVLGELLPREVLRMLGGSDRLNMTLLALNLSGYVNGVAKRHGLVTQEMFPGYPIDSITNGVHSETWTCPAFRKLFDGNIPGWRRDPSALRHAVLISPEAVWEAHRLAKDDLFQELARRGVASFDQEAFTIGFARRATHYKRADLVLSDPGRLAQVARRAGPVQILFAGKAHPHDGPGKDIIRHVFRVAKELGDSVRIAYLENYDMSLAGKLTSGADLWLNTPLPPLEASGTSGMKAAHNGVPSLSVPDGWWVEGAVEGATGWSIGDGRGGPDGNVRDAENLYRKLEEVILPLYYRDRPQWTLMMRQVIALNASFFNSQRMVEQYIRSAYARSPQPGIAHEGPLVQ
jgi:starch phosphorylase